MNQLQRAFYSGYCACHAVVWQTVDTPHGMVMHMWGPGAGRHQDRWRVRESQINTLMRDAQEGNEEQYSMFGDNIFLPKSHLDVKHGGEPYMLTDRQLQENFARPRARVSIEWNYGSTSSLFRYVSHTANNKVCGGGSNIALAYFTAVLLKNCHVCLYHSETSNFFDIAPPTLEEYMQVL
jgi:hypothetical protein